MVEKYIFFKKKKFNGQVFFFYMIWYGLGRTIIEGLRTDSLYIMGTGIRVSQLLALLICVAGIALMVLFAVKNKKKNIKVINENNRSKTNT